MVEIARKTRIETGLKPGDVSFEALLEAQEPVLFKGMASDWPLVQAGLQSAAAAIDYIRSFDGGRQVVSYTGAPEIGGRFFYNADMSGLNFRAGRMPLARFLDEVVEHLDAPDAPALYIGSTDIDTYLPGLRASNDLVGGEAMFERFPPLASIWMGNRTIASAHFDMSNNIACCAVGRRRFTLFPPEQIHNLYPGPLSPTPGGQVVSMVDFDAPDPHAHPRFGAALEAAQVAEMEPGDVLFYPAMWWHQVEALEPFNVLVNYWWNTVPAFMDTPMNTLLHGLISLRDRPEAEKRAWRELFEYYVFGPAGQAAAHLPEHARGPLGPMDATTARRLRAELLGRLNR